jgi:hypothetical protein
MRQEIEEKFWSTTINWVTVQPAIRLIGEAQISRELAAEIMPDIPMKAVQGRIK